MHSRRKYGGKELAPGKFRVTPGEYYAFWLLALFINVSNKQGFESGSGESG